MLKLVLAFVATAAASLSFAGDDAARDPKQDLKLMQGKWEESWSLLADTRVLKKYLPDHVEDFKSVRVEGNQLRLGSKGRSLTIANNVQMDGINASVGPGHNLIVFTLEDGRAMLGSYRLDGDELVVKVPPSTCNRTCSTIRLVRVKN